MTPGTAALPEALRLLDDGSIPNNPQLAALVYDGPAVSSDAAAIEASLRRNGWTGLWRNGIYGFHHYHSTAHECLVIAAGWVRVRLGGAGGPVRELTAGDVVVLPAGTGHKNEGASHDLLVIGAYPCGQVPDLCRGEPGERPAVLERIAPVSLPLSDPLFGTDGPLMRAWKISS